MPSTLRTIAVHVEEPAPGRFAWVLTERSGTRWTELETAPEPVDTYRLAMADGLLALQALATNLDIGPREEQAEEDAAAPADGDDADAQEPPAAAPRRASLFGFGPAK